jgi:hypothetical protein
LAWYDLPQLALYRNRVSSFYHAQLLTQGNPIGLSALATRLHDATASSIEAICSSDDDIPLIAQAQHTLGDRSARLTFITPEPEENHPGLPAMLDFLTIRAGEMGAANLLAEVRETSHLIEPFRRCGFTIYGWETIWRLPAVSGSLNHGANSSWKNLSSQDESAVRNLYHTLVPPLVQTMEPFIARQPNRLVYQENGDTLAFVESRVGIKGIYLIPFIHPSLQSTDAMLAELQHLFMSTGKPVYLQMRSYQAWLTVFLEQMRAETTVHFALMARHLALPEYAAVEQNHLAIENRRPETTAPIVNKSSRSGQ